MSNPTLLTAIRTAAQQKGLYQKFFSPGASQFSQGATALSEFRTVCKLAGVTLPQNTNIGLDGVQMILAGGSFFTDVEMGAKTLQCVGDASNALGAVTQLLGDLGVIDHQFGDFVGLASNVALAIASGGANVLADIGAVISLIAVVGDLGQDFNGNPAAAKSGAQKALAGAVGGFVSTQAAYAATQAKAYNAGNLDVFDFIANIALNAPLDFPGFFPQLKAFFPGWMTVNFTGTGNSSGWFSNSTDTERYTLREMYTTRQQVRAVLYREYLYKPLMGMNQCFSVSRAMSMQALSSLSLLLSTAGKTPTLGFNYDYLSALQMLGVTPYWLGDDWLFKGFLRRENELPDWQSFLPYAPLTLPWYRKPTPSGVVINGQPVNYGQNAQQKLTDKQVAMQIQFQAWDEAGDIESLLGNAESKAILAQWANTYFDPQFGADGTVINMQLGRGATDVSRANFYKTDVKLKKNPIVNPLFQPYIRKNYGVNASDYWKCLSVIKTMQQSNILGDELAKENLDPIYGTMSAIEQTFNSAYKFMTCKALNVLARQRLSNNMKIPQTRLASRIEGKTQVFYQK